MKKILFILFTVFIAFSCKDLNEDNFDWYEDAERPTNLANYEYTLKDADYTTIAGLLRQNRTKADSLLATNIESAKRFSTELNPAYILPFFLSNKYYTADVKSSVKVTYPYDDDRDNVLSGLTGEGYVLTEEDYGKVWGNSPLVISLTPNKSPDSNIPNILKERFPNAANGEYKTVEYYYSQEEPVTTIVESGIWEETMEGYSAGSGVKAEIDGWINTDTKGSLFWQMRSYSNNNYAQVSSYQTGVENDAWLITEAIDLTEATTNPMLSFDLVAGNYNTTCLKIFVSSDFNGNEDGILTATWNDVTSDFTLPTPASGYSPWASAGTSDLSAYKGETIYIAFKYEGNDSATGTKATTTYQLDNVKVGEEIVGVDVEEKAIQYLTYTCEVVNNDATWKPVDNSIITLQPKDYADMGLSYGTLNTTLAADYIPKYLRDNFYGAEGNEKVVVYRTGTNVYYADRFSFSNQNWTVNTTLSDRTSQFIRAENNNVKSWVFNPTIINAMSKDDYQILVDYVIANYAGGNPNLVHANRNAEYYFGFSNHYSNVSYREVDRGKDLTYPGDGTEAEKIAFMNQRTIDGLEIMLATKYPDATPEVSGIVQYARIDNLLIYMEPGAGNNVTWTYVLKCVGNKKWEFVGREGSDGRLEGTVEID